MGLFDCWFDWCLVYCLSLLFAWVCGVLVCRLLFGCCFGVLAVLWLCTLDCLWFDVVCCVGIMFVVCWVIDVGFDLVFVWVFACTLCFLFVVFEYRWFTWLWYLCLPIGFDYLVIFVCLSGCFVLLICLLVFWVVLLSFLCLCWFIWVCLG